MAAERPSITFAFQLLLFFYQEKQQFSGNPPTSSLLLNNSCPRMSRQPFLVTAEVRNENITPPVSTVDEEQEKEINNDSGQPGKSNCLALLRP